MMSDELDNWLTTSQVMERIGWKSRSTVLTLGRRYEWRKQMVGGAWLYWRADIEHYIEQRLAGEVPAHAKHTLRPE